MMFGNLKEIWRDNPLRTALMAILCLILGASAAVLTIDAANSLQPPIVIMPDTHMTGTANPGGILALEVLRENIAPSPLICDGSTDWLLWRWIKVNGQTMREVASFAYRGQANPFSNDTRFVWDLPIRAQVAPGDWNFQGFFHPPCSLLARVLKPKVYPSQVVPVHITAPDAGKVHIETDR